MGGSGLLSIGVLLGDGKATVLNDDTVSPGLIGTAVVLVLGIAVIFLLRSFVKQVRKVPPDGAPLQTGPVPPTAPGSGPAAP